ncbi:N-acetylglucosaminidase [Clostridium taeniosporum]|uniref:Mannosyl-glycoprotein endo-beta-N-acetylglucosamidase-like domain-containing protein n=1 Tax=Clostridium taeniosporum TaxID=394958 RepID=A0A1D7XLG1_9CLOT|nr:glucosaminidase domain-containing protein [Clostridium taeniosporum]AOR24127.1 hypothetical protein BGI42_10470 [Clostridium taeniosporum]
MNFKRKISLFARTLIFVFFISSINVYAASIKVNSLNVSKQLAKVGETITINASATGSKNLLYQFSIYDGAKWYVLQNYSSKSTTIWKPYRASTSKIKVEVKDKNSEKIYDSKEISYEVYSNVKVQNIVTDKKSPQEIHKEIKLTTNTNLSTDVLYKYSVFDGNTWSALKDYSYDKSCIWKPTKAGIYKLRVDVKEANSLRNSDAVLETNFTVINPIEIQPLSKNKVVNYINTNITLDGLLNSQMNLLTKPQTWNNGVWVDALKDQAQYYLNPNNFINDNGINQFLKLNYMDGITVQDLNAALVGKGVLEGKGQAFLDAGKLYNVNPVYLVAHSLLETGNGTSKLATGILLNSIHETFGDINSKLISLNKDFKVYNVYGCGAYDSNPDLWGSEKAYNDQWFSVEQAIIGGAKYISKGYINNAVYNQNTLYKMRWDMKTLSQISNVQYAHQYATDIGWAYKQSQIMKNIIGKMSNSTFYYEIPKFVQ